MENVASRYTYLFYQQIKKDMNMTKLLSLALLFSTIGCHSSHGHLYLKAQLLR